MNIEKQLYEALQLRYRSNIADAKARLNIYFTNSVGIGEHPQLTEEMDHLIAQIEESSGKLETLKSFYLDNFHYNDKDKNNELGGTDLGLY